MDICLFGFLLVILDCLIFGNSMDFWHVMHVPCKIELQGHLLGLSCYAECFCHFAVLAASWTWKIYMVVKSFKWSSDAAPTGTPEELYTAPTKFLDFLCAKAAGSHTHACLSIGLSCLNACIWLAKMLLVYLLMNPISFFWHSDCLRLNMIMVPFNFLRD